MAHGSFTCVNPSFKQEVTGSSRTPGKSSLGSAGSIFCLTHAFKIDPLDFGPKSEITVSEGEGMEEGRSVR